MALHVNPVPTSSIGDDLATAPSRLGTEQDGHHFLINYGKSSYVFSQNDRFYTA